MDERLLELRQAVLETGELYQHAQAVHADVMNPEQITEEMKRTARDCISAGEQYGAALMELINYVYDVTVQGVGNDEAERVQKVIDLLEKETQAYERVLIS